MCMSGDAHWYSVFPSARATHMYAVCSAVVDLRHGQFSHPPPYAIANSCPHASSAQRWAVASDLSTARIVYTVYKSEVPCLMYGFKNVVLVTSCVTSFVILWIRWCYVRFLCSIGGAGGPLTRLVRSRGLHPHLYCIDIRSIPPALSGKRAFSLCGSAVREAVDAYAYALAECGAACEHLPRRQGRCYRLT